MSVIDGDGDDFATVRTNRGEVKGRQVIHATNSWIGHLLREMRPFISPVRANVQRQVPRPNTLTVGDQSFWLRYGEKEYDYMIQRPDGSYIVGRASTGRRDAADDSKLDLTPGHLVPPEYYIRHHGLSNRLDINTLTTPFELHPTLPVHLPDPSQLLIVPSSGLSVHLRSSNCHILTLRDPQLEPPLGNSYQIILRYGINHDRRQRDPE